MSRLTSIGGLLLVLIIDSASKRLSFYVHHLTIVSDTQQYYIRRIRRQTFPPNPSVFVPRHVDYYLPPFYQANPGRDASSLTPIFPFSSQYSNGLDVNSGTRFVVDGNLNVPMFGWGLWDMKGKYVVL